MATFGRSAWIAVLLVGGAGVILAGSKFIRTSAIIVGLIGLLLIVSVPELNDRLISSFDLSSNADRLNLWKTALAMTADKPLFGIGPGLFGQEFTSYMVAGKYDATGHPHNDYLNLAATSGIFTLVAWLLIWGSWFYYCIKAYRNLSPLQPDRPILLGIILSITGILVASFFQCYYTDLENNICWCFLSALGLQIVKEKGLSKNSVQV